MPWRQMEFGPSARHQAWWIRNKIFGGVLFWRIKCKQCDTRPKVVATIALFINHTFCPPLVTSINASSYATSTAYLRCRSRNQPLFSPCYFNLPSNGGHLDQSKTPRLSQITKHTILHTLWDTKHYTLVSVSREMNLNLFLESDNRGFPFLIKKLHPCRPKNLWEAFFPPRVAPPSTESDRLSVCADTKLCDCYCVWWVSE